MKEYVLGNYKESKNELSEEIIGFCDKYFFSMINRAKQIKIEFKNKKQKLNNQIFRKKNINNNKFIWHL